MGGSGSRERKLTIENDSPMSVIKVSEDVVHRMKGKEGTGAPVRRIGQGDGQMDPYVYQQYQAPLTSIQLRQATIDALKDNDDYWDKRIKSLQQRHQQMQHIMEEEFCKAMEEMRGSNAPHDSKQKTDTCVDNRKQIIACYKKCKDQPLKCAKEVQEFAECIDQRRASLIAKAKC